MTMLADLVGELSWGLMAAWIGWAAWIAIQVAWRRRARVTVLTTAGPAPARIGQRLTLGIAAGPEGMRASAATPARPSMDVSSLASTEEDLAEPIVAATKSIEASTEPETAAKRPRRRRQSPRAETATAMPA